MGETTGGRLLLTQNGDRLYAVDRRVISVYNTTDLSLIATIEIAPEDFVEGAELDANGNLYVTYRNDSFVPTEIGEDMIEPSRILRIFGIDLTELRSVDFPASTGILSVANDVSLSGDDQRLIYLAESFEGILEVNFLTAN